MAHYYLNVTRRVTHKPGNSQPGSIEEFHGFFACIRTIYLQSNNPGHEFFNEAIRRHSANSIQHQENILFLL